MTYKPQNLGNIDLDSVYMIWSIEVGIWESSSKIAHNKVVISLYLMNMGHHRLLEIPKPENRLVVILVHVVFYTLVLLQKTRWEWDLPGLERY